MGPEIADFENEIASLCGRKYAVAVGSCTDALFFALKVSGIQANDEVLVTSFSYLASATPILRAGAIPVFVDIVPTTYMMDPDDLKRKITGRTKAIIGVHLFGTLLGIEQMESIAKLNKLILIEDAAQAIGCNWGTRKGGSMGDVSCFSFDPTKVIGAFGNGGVLLTDDPKISGLVSSMRNHGKNPDTGKFGDLGYNSKLSSAQAGLLSYQLGLLGDLIKRRETVAGLYAEKLNDIVELTLPTHHDGQTSNYHKYVIKLDRRDQLQEHLTKNGIETKVHYPYIIPELPIFKEQKHETKSFGEAQKAKATLLSLPIYPELKQEEINAVCRSIRAFFEN